MMNEKALIYGRVWWKQNGFMVEIVLLVLALIFYGLYFLLKGKPFLYIAIFLLALYLFGIWIFENIILEVKNE